ncbi:MAG: DUF456 domain-containing protein [Chloroflexota bacterium]|nr:DUF456 domain-containing protein [Chloroflexota bacterium]
MSAWLLASLKIILLSGMVLGLFGLIIPVFPGLTVIWLLTALYGLVYGFGTLGGWLFALITLLTIAGLLVDNVLMGAKAKQEGAHWASLAAAFIAGLVGSFVLTPLGGIATALLALFAMEYYYCRERDIAFSIVKGMLIGWGWAFIARFGIGIVMIALWAIWAWG